MTPYARELQLAAETAREAGALLRAAFGNVQDVRYKSVVDPVTAADRASEELIAASLLSAFPGDRLLAEEGSGAGQNDASRRAWVVDPLDGTVNFLHGYPVFCVSIALLVDGSPVVGAVYDPMRDELFAAEAGHGATRNDRPLSVSTTDTLMRAMLCTGFAYDVTWRQENVRYFERFIDATQAVRRDGAAALDIVYVAAGRFDGYWERGVAVWDVAAATLILLEAGGTLTGYDGRPYDPFSPDIVASNGLLHQAMLDVLASVQADSPPGTVDFT